jgi:hypothetical protein
MLNSHDVQFAVAVWNEDFDMAGTLGDVLKPKEYKAMVERLVQAKLVIAKPISNKAYDIDIYPYTDEYAT